MAAQSQTCLLGMHQHFQHILAARNGQWLPSNPIYASDKRWITDFKCYLQSDCQATQKTPALFAENIGLKENEIWSRKIKDISSIGLD